VETGANLSDLKFKIFSRIFRWFGLAAIAFSAFLLISNIVFWLRADTATGTVVTNKVMEGMNRPNIYEEDAYAPVIRFETETGETVELVSDVGYGKHFAYGDGDEVPVLYLPANPQDGRIRSFGELIGLPFVLAGFAGVFWIVGIFAQFMYEANSKAGKDSRSR